MAQSSTRTPAQAATSSPRSRHRGSRIENTAPATARGQARTHPKPPSSHLAEVKARRQKFNDETRFFVLNGNQLRISIDLAREIGDRESIMLLQYEFWLATEGVEVGDRRAVHDSYRALHHFFSFWSYSTTQRTFDSLVEKGLMYTEPAPGGRNDGRYVFMNFEKARSLKSIVVARVPASESESQVSEPEPEPEEQVYQDETPSANQGQVYQSDTPSSDTPPSPVVYHPETPAYRIDTPPYQGDTPASQDGTPDAAPYKERARAEENKEKEESGGETRAQDEVANEGESTTHTAPAQPIYSQNQDALHALFYEPDVQVLLAVFGFNPTRPSSLQSKDWEVLPSAVEFMRSEKIEGAELRTFSHIANLRWSYSPYLSQLETHFYKLMPARARAKALAIEAQTRGSAVGAPADAIPQGTPLIPATPTDELLDNKQERRRRAFRVCANVFLELPEAEQAARREAAVNELGPLERDRYLRDLQQGRPTSFGIEMSWREHLLKAVWNEHRATCEAQLSRMTDDVDTTIAAGELGAIPALAAFLEQRREEASEGGDDALRPSDPVRPRASGTGDAMADAGDVAGALLNSWRPPVQAQQA